MLKDRARPPMGLFRRAPGRPATETGRANKYNMLHTLRCTEDPKRSDVMGHELPRRLPRRAAEAPLITDAKVVSRRGGDGPLSDLSNRSKIARYSITSSAVVSSDGGTISPRAFAARTLTASSNLIGASTGRSAGLAPLRIRST
jgi:hypothetical protein